MDVWVNNINNVSNLYTWNVTAHIFLLILYNSGPFPSTNFFVQYIGSTQCASLLFHGYFCETFGLSSYSFYMTGLFQLYTALRIVLWHFTYTYLQEYMLQPNSICHMSFYHPLGHLHFDSSVTELFKGSQSHRFADGNSDSVNKHLTSKVIWSTPYIIQMRK